MLKTAAADHHTMKTIPLLATLLMLSACTSGLPELKYADGSKRIPVNPQPPPRPNAPTLAAAAAAATPPPASTPDATAAAITQATPPAGPKTRCVRRKAGAAAAAPAASAPDSERFSKWLFPVTH